MSRNVLQLSAEGMSMPGSVESTRVEDRVIQPIVVVTLALYLGLGLLLGTVELPTGPPSRAAGARHVTFHVAEVTPPPAPEPVSEPEPEIAPEITPETVLAQAIDLSVPENAETPAPAEEAADEPEPPRRVYGVRKVFARGIGSGDAAGALVVKRGNTLDGVADTLTAIEADLRGSLAPLSTVTEAPRPLERFKPQYSEALREARATGTVTARLLVDTDGRVRRVEVMSDIGHDSRDLAIAAFERFRFRPAMRGEEAVAVWILHKIRFEFQE